jgi:hypothetical protein
VTLIDAFSTVDERSALNLQPLNQPCSVPNSATIKTVPPRCLVPIGAAAIRNSAKIKVSDQWAGMRNNDRVLAFKLASAVSALAGKVPVSIYNLPLCVLPRSIWAFAAQSISDSKNGYSDECADCSERSRCAVFFTSGRPRKSRGISPILVSSGLDG